MEKRWTRRPEGSNWGDYGADDQLGRLNEITDDVRRRAVDEVKEGRAFALSLPLDLPGGDGELSLRRSPKLFASEVAGYEFYNFPLTNTGISSDDGVTLWLQYSTQWDSLAHFGRVFDVDGSGTEQAVYYNGFRAGRDVLGPDGESGPQAKRLGIEHMAATGVQGRGVLIDLARAVGTDRTAVGYEDLMRAIDDQGVEVRRGDIVLLHTGYGDALLDAAGTPDEAQLHSIHVGLDGSDDALLRWIDDSGLAALVSDNVAVELFDLPFDESEGKRALPLHDHCLFKLGIHLGELWWLGDLARYLGETGRHSFLLTAPPLRLPGAVGSPTTPVATV